MFTFSVQLSTTTGAGSEGTLSQEAVVLLGTPVNSGAFVSCTTIT